MKTILIVAIFLACLLATIVGAVHMWGDAEISLNGYIALVLGSLATLGVGGGLMALVFYSARHGYDDMGGGEREGPESSGADDGDSRR